MVQQLKSMYAEYQRDPQGFVKQCCDANPKVAEVLRQVQNPTETFNKMLNNYGMSKEDFGNIFR